MKTLHLVRHAKSSHDVPFLEDVLRGLADRGKADSKLIGQYLADSKVSISRVYSSHSVRTKATLAILNRYLHIPDEAISFHKELYTFDDSGETFMKFAKKTDDMTNAIMILSHNYSCAQFALSISKGKVINYPTCGALKCIWDVTSWSEVTMENVSSVSMVTPKMLKG